MSEIRTVLTAYARAELPFANLQHWFTDVAWHADEQYSGADLQLVRNVERAIAEFTGHHIPENRLRAVVAEAVGLRTGGFQTKS